MIATTILALTFARPSPFQNSPVELIEKHLSSTSADERLNAVRRLISLPASGKVAQLLMRVASDAGPEVRLLAVETLGKQGSGLDSAVTPQWKWRLGEQGNRHNREQWETWQQELVDVLSARAKDESPKVKLAAYRALARLGAPLSDLGVKAMCGTGRQLINRAMRAFSQSAESNASLLKDFLADDEPQLVYATVCHWSDSATTKAALHQFLNDSRPEWRAMAAEQLGNENQRPREELDRLLADSNELVRRGAISALSDSKEYVKYLLSHYANPPSMMKLSILSIIVALEDSESFDAVVTRYCFDAHSKVREEALGMASSLRLPQELLIRYLRDTNEWVRARSAELLAQQYEGDAMLQLKPLLRDRSEHVRDNVFDAMCGCASAEDINYLVSEFRRMKTDRPDYALSGLLGKHWPATERLIKSLLHDRGARVRHLAVNVLRSRVQSKTPDPSLWPLLVNAAEDPDSTVRAEAVGAFCDPQVPGAFEAAVRLLKDPSKAVRLEAICAVAMLGGERALTLIQPLMDDPDDQIARQATAEHSRLEKRKE